MVSKQLSLDGFETPPRLTDRLFFGIFPPADVATAIAQLAQYSSGKYGLKGEPLRTERFHVTLHHIGDYVGLRERVVAAAIEAAASVIVPSFEVKFDRVMSFKKSRNRPFVLCGGEVPVALTVLQQALSTAMAKVVRGSKVTSHFNPHVTLLYDNRGVDEQAVEPVRWIAREFVLVHSLLGQTRHEWLARWPLRN